MTLKDFASQNNLRLLNFPELDEIDDITAERAVSRTYARIERSFPGFELTLQAKAFQKNGSRKQHQVHSRALAPKLRLVATATEWNFLTALQKSLKEVERELSRKLGR